MVNGMAHLSEGIYVKQTAHASVFSFDTPDTGSCVQRLFKRVTVARLLLTVAILTQIFFVILVVGSGRFANTAAKAFRKGFVMSAGSDGFDDASATTSRRLSTTEALSTAMQALDAPIIVLIPHLDRADRIVNTSKWRDTGFRPHVYTFLPANISTQGAFFPRTLAVSNRSAVMEPHQKRQSQQLLDFISMLRHFSGTNVCQAAGFFLLADDDVSPCDGAKHHIHAAILQLGSRVATGRVRAIRFSVGTNGVLMLCSDILGFLSFVEAHLQQPDPQHAVDILLDTWAATFMVVYKHNLLEHAATVSNIWSQAETTRRDAHLPACGEPILWSGLSFDLVACKNSPFTPCERSSLQTEGKKEEIRRVFEEEMDTETAQAYISRLQIQLAPMDTSCAKFCRLRGEKCDTRLLKLANQCSVLMSLYPACEKCEAANGREHPSVATHPGRDVYYSVCHVQAITRMTTCQARWERGRRACLCRAKKEAEIDDVDEGDFTVETQQEDFGFSNSDAVDGGTPDDMAWLQRYLDSLKRIENELQNAGVPAAPPSINFVDSLHGEPPVPQEGGGDPINQILEQALAELGGGPALPHGPPILMDFMPFAGASRPVDGPAGNPAPTAAPSPIWMEFPG